MNPCFYPSTHALPIAGPAQTRKRLAIALVALASLNANLRAQEPILLAQNTAPTGEKFVPRERRSPVANVEILSEATIYGSEVTLRQICRWPEADDAGMQPLAELVLLRMPAGSVQATITLEQILLILHDAGTSVATINFAGAMTCTITRSDVAFDERGALDAWATGQDLSIAPDGASIQTVLAVDAVTQQQQKLHDTPAPGAFVDDGTLKAALMLDLATRLKLPPDTLQMDFRVEDRSLLTLAAPQFQFQIQPQRTRADLGQQRWVVSITSGAATRKVQVVAAARAWQEQVLVAKPIAFKQPIDADSVEARRVLIDHLGNDPVVARDVVIGSAATRDLPPGTVVTARLITPVELARPGQLVTVVMRRGGVEVRSVATAMQAGTYGQFIRVKMERTREQIDVRLVGAQLGVAGDDMQAPLPTRSAAAE